MNVTQRMFNNDSWEHIAPALEQWKKLSREERLSVLHQISDITSRAYGKDLGIDFSANQATINTSHSDFLSAASYSDHRHTIFIQNGKIKNINIVSDIVHEATHHGQNLFVSKDRSDIPEHMRDEYDAIKATSALYKSKIFGIETSGTAYISTNDMKLDKYVLLRMSFYSLCALERQAREASYSVCEKLGLPTKDIQAGLQTSINVFKDRYHCSHFTDQQIFDLVDDSIINVVTGRIPRNNFEASMTYDLAALLYGADKEHYKESLKMLSSNEKAKAMEQAGFEGVHTLTETQIKTISPAQIWLLNKREIDQNPKVIVHGLEKFGLNMMEKTGALLGVKSPDDLVGLSAFERWYFNKETQLTDKEISVVENAFGPTFSKENRELLIEKGLYDFRQEIDLSSLFEDQYYGFSDLRTEWRKEGVLEEMMNLDRG